MRTTMTTRARGHDAGSPVPSLRLLAVLLLAAAFVQACGMGGGGSAELAESLELVPADAQYVGVIDAEQVLSGDVSSVIADQAEDDWEDEFDDIGVFPDELTTYVFAYREDWFLTVVEGEFDFEQIRDDLEDGGYEDDRYRGYEIWEEVAWPDESVALLEDRGWVVTGDTDIVKGALRTLDRGSGSLLDDADSDLRRTLDKAGKGWMVIAGEDECFDFEVQDCRAVGVSYHSSDDDYVVETTVAVLFRNERAAESEMDNLEEAIEDYFEGDIVEVILDGEFVIVTASVDEEFFGSESPDTGSDIPAAPAEPTASVSASDLGDDHGDSVDHATFATVGLPVSGEVNYAGDVDFFAFTAEPGQTYQIDVDLGTLGDSVATLFDADGWALESNDDHGVSWASRIVWTVTEPAVHYVAVEGYGTGSYILTITASDYEAPTAAPTESVRVSVIGDDHGGSADHATFATVGTPVSGEMDYAGDVDFFAFTAEPGQTYQIDVDLGTLGDSVATLYDADGRALEFNDDRGGSWASRIVWTATESAVHYVAVEGYDTGSYSLTVAALDIGDDHVGSADHATFATVGTPVSGEMDYAGDVDFFAFTAEPGQTYQIDVDLGTLGDSVATLYDADGRALEFNDDRGGSWASRIVWTATESAVHYVAVEGYGTGSYSLTVAALDIGDDHGGSADHATFATVGTPVSGEMDYAGDVDFFAFTAEPGQTYQIDVDLGTLGDSVATLYDADGRALEFNDDRGGSWASRIVWTATESAVHYVAVEGYGTGSYSLTVAALDIGVPTATTEPEYTCAEGADPTPLHRAVNQTNLEVVRILADKCSEDLDVVSEEYSYDQTPLSLAVGKGHEEIVRVLVAAGADPNVKVNPAFRVGTHLTYAVGIGDTEIVQILLDAGADANVVDTEQFYEESPLSIAVKAEDVEMVRVLVNAGADPNLRLDQFNEVSPLDIAIEEGYTDIVQILTGTPIGPEAEDSPETEAVPEFACSGGADPTPLHRAVDQTNLEVVRILADKCSEDLNVISSEYFYQQTPLSLAIGKGHEEIVRALVAVGADPDVEVNPDFRVGTHLTYAVGLGDAEIVQILLDAGADANVVDTDQFYEQTPLSLAIGSGRADLLRKLIAAGADPGVEVSPGFRVGTHLTYAVGLGDTEIVQILLDAGADPDVVDTEQFYEESPLSIAVKAEDVEMVRVLVDAGADPNKKLDQFNELSPLDIAIEEGYTDIVQILTGFPG